MKKRRPLYVDLTEEARAALEHAAKADQRSMASYVRKLIADDAAVRGSAGVLGHLIEASQR
jgi:hypothetical protein